MRFLMAFDGSAGGERCCRVAYALVVLLIVCSCNSRTQHADTILSNGKVVTVDGDFTIAQALAIKNGRILAVGDDQRILDLKGDSTMLIDLEGRTVIPGLNEGHAHPIAASQSELSEPIPDVRTIAELLQWIAHEASVKKKGEWIVHPKFFITRLSDMRQMTMEELDAVAPDNPVFLNGSYGGLINSKAIEVSDLRHSKHP
ncbi:MAG TPA: amidohydrolase family protein, partial [Chryseosolibacter sp.]